MFEYQSREPSMVEVSNHVVRNSDYGSKGLTVLASAYSAGMTSEIHRSIWRETMLTPSLLRKTCSAYVRIQPKSVAYYADLSKKSKSYYALRRSVHHFDLFCKYWQARDESQTNRGNMAHHLLCTHIWDVLSYNFNEVPEKFMLEQLVNAPDRLFVLAYGNDTDLYPSGLYAENYLRHTGSDYLWDLIIKMDEGKIPYLNWDLFYRYWQTMYPYMSPDHLHGFLTYATHRSEAVWQ